MQKDNNRITSENKQDLNRHKIEYPRIMAETFASVILYIVLGLISGFLVGFFLIYLFSSYITRNLPLFIVIISLIGGLIGLGLSLMIRKW